MTFAYVVTIADTPTHSATTLLDAQETALTAEKEYQSDRHDYRWDEYHQGRTWRLMQRRKGAKGRYAWTGRAVHAVEHITT